MLISPVARGSWYREPIWHSFTLCLMFSVVQVAIICVWNSVKGLLPFEVICAYPVTCGPHILLLKVTIYNEALLNGMLVG